MPMLVVTWKAPEPEEKPCRPRRCARRCGIRSWDFSPPPRASKSSPSSSSTSLADQLAQALTRPFLIDMGYGADDRGIALATVGLVGTIVGAFLGGWLTTLAGLGHALWMFGVLQIFSNAGYFLLAERTRRICR